ncbi:MAG: PfkB family carbohydrate kinase [Oligoflexia bacterium]|nr:PfkB family carbohydrate kinase [Oligoflexia bacterium]
MAKKTKPEDFKRKIKTREELREIIGPRPRKKSVIMCHGTFDIVHPGHIRHLIYAKEKAHVLIASLTSDIFINKGQLRPFVPEQLRAMNLAALEVVDYVIIDERSTPLENLKFLQPDYFAKGYDYSNTTNIPPKTKEEIDVLESYGGEIIFTPGDVVYSSSAIIENTPPKISIDKLVTLMKSENITFDDLRKTLSAFKDISLHVVGDTIVDSYTHCSMIGSGTKTPTFSVKYEDQVDFVGGAAVVAKHMRKTGAKVKLTTVLGEDPLKDFVLNDLKVEGIECNALVDKTRPTTQKNAFIAKGYHLLKVDKLDNRPISDKVLSEFKNSISDTKSDAVVFSDFRHGIFSRRTIPALIDSIPKNTMRVADSQVASRWGNILEFRGFDLITPNEREARFALGDQDSVIRPLALDLYKAAECKYLILKLGERGIITYRPRNDDNDPRAFFTIDTFVERLVDPVGAGDALVSYATLALIATKSEVIASILGSMAAAVACEHEGNNPVPPEEVMKILDINEKRAQYS